MKKEGFGGFGEAKKLLSNALFSLVKKKPFEKVTVCDICDEAMVHRATFYSHFADKYALLTYSIDEHIPLELPEIAADDGSPYSPQKWLRKSSAILTITRRSTPLF